MTTRREFLAALGTGLLLCPFAMEALAQPGAGKRRSAAPGPATDFSVILGCPTDQSITMSIAAATAQEVVVLYGAEGKPEAGRSPVLTLRPNAPGELVLRDLAPGTRYHYRLARRAVGASATQQTCEGNFHTQRAADSGFVFTVQGDSHPERVGIMYDPDMYRQMMENVAADRPDFHVMMGDDFSLDRLIESNTRDQDAVDAIYRYQRSFLGLLGQSSAVFHVNGNHEQAAKYLLDGTPNSFAAMAGRARAAHLPLPVPDRFYSGDAEAVEHMGLPRDYYAWEWGGALFVVLDLYWHSPVQLSGNGKESTPGGGGKRGAGGKRGGGRDLWQATVGEAQYRWLSRVLLESKARWKFIFCHHVLGTGRGGIEMAREFEWGGRDRRGKNLFAQKRPGWELPIHELMVKAGVNIFFQGHDHLYARQELDGIVYQSCPCPADPTYSAFNKDAYRSGTVLPNSGHLRISVEKDAAKVEYVSVVGSPGVGTNRGIAHGYTLKPTVKAAG